LGIQTVGQLDTHYLKGSLFESFVFSEIVKNRFNRGMEHNCFYWRDKTGNEIDCIIESGNSAMPLEIKASKTIVNDFFAGFSYWGKLTRLDKASSRGLTGRNSRNSYLVYGGDENQKREHTAVVSWKNIASIFDTGG
jgi:predicted AAA+ superfamily ATPase